MEDLPSVGERILVDQTEAATVRYVGPVAGTEGTWIGVEFDKPGRGKHDGSHNGTRYFTCSSEEGNSASFVRPAKIKRGITLLEALNTKYQEGNVLDKKTDETGAKSSGLRTAREEAAPGDDGVFVRTAGGRKVAVEICMKESLMAKMRRLDRLPRAYLSDMGVSAVGPPGALGAEAPALEVIDVQGNLFSDWRTVIELAENLPKLRVLNFGRNRCEWPQQLPALPTFPGLRTLILTGCRITWQQVAALQPVFPGLEELHASGCGIRTLATEKPASWSNLRVLYLEDNVIDDWGEVKHLGALPQLEKLHLGGNRIPALFPFAEPSPDGSPPFPKISAVFLGDNKLEDWSSIDALNFFPGLVETRLTGNPCVEANRYSRYEIVARVRSLRLLNGSMVGNIERRDSELRYLRRVLSEDIVEGDPADRRQRLIASKPHLAPLLEKHGDVVVPQPGQTMAAAPSSRLGSGMLSIVLSCPSSSKCQSIEKKVPPSMTLGKLKVVCEKLFGLKASDVSLSICRQGVDVPEQVTDDRQDLYLLGVTSGDTILISE